MAKLTVKTVEAIKPAEDRREIPDALLPGLYLIVQPSGARSWAVRYRHGDRTRKHTLGSYPALDLKTARELGAKTLRVAAEGRDPGHDKKQERGTTVEDVVGQFLDRHCRHNHSPRTRKESERLLRLYLLSRWSSRPARSISRAEVRDMLDRLMADGTPVLANRVHSIARKLFGWAVEQDIIPASPLAGLKAPAVEKSRDRVLTDLELRRVWNAAGETPDLIYGAMVRFLILTGQRRGEVAGLEWSELDLGNRLWSIPKERTKNGRAHDVPLSRQAIATLKELPHTNERYVFSVNGKAAINGFGKPKDRLDALCGFTDWTIHDIRRSVASGMARLGIGLPVIEKVLNHTSGSFAGIVGVYQRHDFAKEKRDALEAWGDHVAKLVVEKDHHDQRRKTHH
jgi:integrase